MSMINGWNGFARRTKWLLVLGVAATLVVLILLLHMVSLTGIDLDRTTQMFAVDTVQLRATVVPSTFAKLKVAWSSSNDSVAIVSSTGLVTGISEGRVLITATTAVGIKKANCVVTVSQHRHTILRGESVWSIANMYRVTTDSIMLENVGLQPAEISVGQIIAIPKYALEVGIID